MHVEFRDRSGRSEPTPNGVLVRPLRFGWAAVGGPLDAEIEASGNRDGLVNLLNRLGHEVRISNIYGQLVWWGYIEEVVISLGAYQLGMSLAGMYNRVAVAYTYQDVDNFVRRGTTDWHEHAESVNTYGPKELLYSASELDSLDSAESLAQALADRLGDPIRIMQIGEGEPDTARIRCRGFYSTLSWRYYKQLAGRVAHDVYNGDQVLGVGWEYTGRLVFDEERTTIYQVGAHHGYRSGDKIVVSGTTHNNGTKTVGTATNDDLIFRTIPSDVRFTASDDIYAPPGSFVGIKVDDWILIEGSSAGNNGMHQVGRVRLSIPYPDNPSITVDHIEVVGSTNQEGPTGPITITRMGYIRTEEGLTNEGPTAGTIRAWGIRLAQSFTLPHDVGSWNAHEILLRIRKQGAPTDGVRVSLCANQDNAPGTVLAQATLNHDQLGISYGWETWGLGTGATLNFGTTYWILVERTGSMDMHNYYELAVDQDAGYSDGTLLLWDGSSWHTRPTNASLAFEVIGRSDTGAQIATMIEQAGGMLKGARLSTTFVRLPTYRDGDSLTIDEVERLLAVGTDAGSRLLIHVSEERIAGIGIRPTKNIGTYLLRGDGTVLDEYGQPLPPGVSLAGKWVKLDKPVVFEAMAQEMIFFVEQADYDAETGRWQLTPEGAPDPYDIASIRQG